MDAHEPSDDAVLVERRDRVLVVTLNRPELRNAASPAVAAGIETAMDTLEHDPRLQVGVITGAGGAFCSGADLSEVLAGRMPETARRGLFGLVREVPDKTLIAAVEGLALAGGCELALACDLVVAARGARFGLPEVRHGLVALGGGLIRLPRAIPHRIATEMALTGEPRTAEELHHHGLVNILCEPGTALETALGLADRICRNSPVAVEATRRVLRATLDAPSTAEAWARQDALASLESLTATDDFREGLAAFAGKRAPVWRRTAV
ncbi:MAG: crotonase/enoyl-CoA hydratase family protein [Acidimicrobiia bacterium]|nr:crotonase/enoyl-CoA hydratase family protein [Acidimicrobiia bacterium]